MAQREMNEQTGFLGNDQSESILDEQQQDSCSPQGGGAKPKPRLRCAERKQTRLEVVDLDSLLDPDHRARVVWQYVEAMDLDSLLKKIASVEHHPGHPVLDPRIALSLWILATLEGVGSARLLARLCQEHVAYRWILGGVSVNYHTLASFRSHNTQEFDEILSQSIGVLCHQGLLEMQRVSQDGVRVRANAASSSFRRRPTLETHLEQARQQVELLRKELQDNPQAGTARQRMARQRAASERQQRMEQALVELDKLEKQRARRNKSHNPDAQTTPPKTAARSKRAKAKTKKPAKAAKKKERPARASQSDPQARVMKMANGGFNPAYNVQLAADCATQLVVGVSVSNIGHDNGELGRMHDQLLERYNTHPKQYLADGGFATQADIVRLSQLGCELFIPPMQRKAKKNPRAADQPTDHDTPETLAWRQRMQTDQAQQIYKERASTSECVNALMRNRGLQQLPVRGQQRVKAVALLYALAHNVQRMSSLGIKLKPSAAC